jgi:hypothetical protein
MWYKTLAIGLVVLALGACERSSTDADLAGGIAGPSSLPAMSIERPWQASLTWAVADLQWAGVPGQDKSLFGGRCSAPSDYVITGRAWGEATHAGRLSGTGSHCSQITWSSQGPVAVTYSDGRFEFVVADGSTLTLRYGNGTTGIDPVTGEQWYRDTFTFTGGTGRFEGASGGGEEGGQVADFAAVLAGAPSQMWMKGTITYAPGRGR